jgi:hypothetical protein
MAGLHFVLVAHFILSATLLESLSKKLYILLEQYGKYYCYLTKDETPKLHTYTLHFFHCHLPDYLYLFTGLLLRQLTDWNKIFE